LFTFISVSLRITVAMSFNAASSSFSKQQEVSKYRSSASDLAEQSVLSISESEEESDIQAEELKAPTKKRTVPSEDGMNVFMTIQNNYF
jgi:hypothetical protein